VSVIRGPAGAADISRRLGRAAGGVPAVTTSEAMVEAVQALALERIGVAVPYGPPVTDIIRDFFASAGIRVARMHGLDLPNANNWEALRLPDDAVIRMVAGADSPEAEGVCLGCTSLRTGHLMAALEGAVGKPVVTANGATMWRALRLMGVADRPDHLGRLFKV
ncbi:MAG: maleate cis-trans isomerase family protein, partial [Alphaproteobacteria bacterium]